MAELLFPVSLHFPSFSHYQEHCGVFQLIPEVPAQDSEFCPFDFYYSMTCVVQDPPA